jgi:undecaprenyl-diphosphatase
MSAFTRTLVNIIEVDRSILRWFSTFRRPMIDRLMRGFTRAGDWQSWTALSLAALVAGGPYRTLAVQIVPKLLATLGLCFTIKTLSRRQRPSVAMTDFQSLLKNPDPYSFPSSHTACAWVVCASLGMMLGWGWPIWILYASSISYSRIHVGAHYPLDVLIGTAIGVGMAAL